MSLVLDARHIEGGYDLGSGFLKAVDDCSLYAYEGEMLGVAGESGCGKSTLAKLIMGLTKPPLRLVKGKSIIDDIDVYKLSWKERKKILWGKVVTMIPQASMNALNPTKKIKDVVFDVVREKYSTPPSKSEILDMAKKRFDEIGLDPVALDMYPIELSGGMKQRAIIAISTLLNPSFLIADEPTSALDVSTQKLLLELLYMLIKRNIVKTLIFISHDIATLRQICDKMCIMYAGKILEISDTEDVINRPLHPYTERLMESVIPLIPSIRKKTLKGIPGAPPNLLNPPSGCRFHPRCRYAMPLCKEKEPPLREAKKGRFVSCWLHLG
ncbi:ABC transporter ATP-binding protein [Candidatus Bathyarchaeota archaeon]|nr:ABC transporter ATP-binding protein [Candidatus Bathyarchaeota archaeon]